MITGVVLARNEEQNIVDCLRSLRWHVAEVLLIDMESTDRTVELAKPLVDRVLTHPLVANFDAARNIAIPEATHDWLWFLDADERVPIKTGQYVRHLVLHHADGVAAITIPFKSYFCGQWIQHSGWWPGYTMPRVLRRGSFRFSERLHGGVEFHGRELRVPPDPELAIEHFSYLSIEHYVEKFNRYTSTEAGYLAQPGAKLNWKSAFAAMMRDWWLYYEHNHGHLDGQHGWILAWLAGQYRWFSQAKLLDLQNEKTEDAQSPDIPRDLDAVLDLMQDELATLRSRHPKPPLGIVWRSPIWDPSGYAEDSRVILRSLASGSREVAVEELRWSDSTCSLPDESVAIIRALSRAKRPKFSAAITHCIPTLCQPDPSAALNILRTTFETDRIPENWLPLIERFDELWVLTAHDQLAFRRTGVAPEKMRVLGEFVDTRLFTPKGPKLPLPSELSGRFVFLSVFDWQLRKGWDVLLPAYCREFSVKDGVGLLLKITTLHGHSIDSIREQINDVLSPLSQSLDQRPDIVLWNATLSSDELARLYRSVDGFVLASRGEGWGRPYMEAMASGLPTIGTRGSGNDAFMNDGNSFLISTSLVDVPETAAAEIPVYRGHRWLEPNATELQAAMRRVVSDRQKRRSVSQRAVADMRTKFPLEQARCVVDELLSTAERRFLTKASQFAEIESSQIRVELEGEFFAGHSFSNINEKLALEFLQMPSLALSLRRVWNQPTQDAQATHASRLIPYMNRTLTNGPQVTIRHAFPPNWVPPVTGLWVHIQPWEFGALPLDWVGPLRDRVDEIWAPSNYVRRVYEQSGIPAEKIQVIPWGVNPDVFSPEAPPLILPTKRNFKFLFVGGTMHRKGFDLVLQAYLAEFSKDEDVCLVIKDVGTNTFYRFGNDRERVLQAIESGTAPEIVYNESNMTEGQLASLYTACNCLVAPYRGEGFGLPILEAMACGVPAIVPRGGASDDFVTEDTGYLLPAKLVECRHDWRLCGIPTELAIDVAELQATMRQVYENVTQARNKGRRASEYVREQLTWEKSARRMAERLEHLCRADAPQRDSSLPRNNHKPTLTVCMLSHNSEKTIGDSLASVRPVADETIVLDLGSTDRSIDVAFEYGSRVYCGELTDNLGSVRNATLNRATSDWILILDADEQLSDRESRDLLERLASAPDDATGFRIAVKDQADTAAELGCESAIRLFRNRNEIVFDYRGCDQVDTSIARAGGRVVTSDIAIFRSSNGNGGPCFRSPQTHLRLLHADHADRPSDPQVLLALGNAHQRLKNYFHAECYLNDCLTQLSRGDNLFRDVALQLIDTHFRKGDPARAHELAEQAGIQLPMVATWNSQTGFSKADLVRLYLGAGTKHLDGYTHVDVASGDNIQLVYDLNHLPWPWDDNSVDVVVAEDLVEHLEVGLIGFCNEVWRIMRPGGELFIRTPHHQGDSSWIDPTHRWHLNEQTFHYLDPETYWGKTYSQYTSRKWRIVSLGIRGPQNIHALLMPRK